MSQLRCFIYSHSVDFYQLLLWSSEQYVIVTNDYHFQLPFYYKLSNGVLNCRKSIWNQFTWLSHWCVQLCGQSVQLWICFVWDIYPSGEPSVPLYGWVLVVVVVWPLHRIECCNFSCDRGLSDAQHLRKMLCIPWGLGDTPLNRVVPTDSIIDIEP